MKPPQTRQQLLQRRCNAETRALSEAEIAAQLSVLPGWSFEEGSLQRTLAFADYYETIAFVNALAWIVHGEDHHPDLLVQYNRCTVRWNTHSVNGISDNDFVCAAKTDAVYARNGQRTQPTDTTHGEGLR